MINQLKKSCLAVLLCCALPAQNPADPLAVCATTPNLADLLRQVGGDQVEVSVFCRPAEDAHFVDAKPSFVRLLSRADLLVSVGLQLEIGWLPTLIRQARNTKIQPGQPGYLDASQAIVPLEVRREAVDRSQGDVHAEGNPHYLTDPIRALAVARLLQSRLAELRPEMAEGFSANFDRFRLAMGKALVGEELLDTYEFEKLATLFEFGRLTGFLEEQGDAQKLSGWFQKLAAFRGTKIVADHNAWPYFTKRFGLETIGFLEPLPGIPPSTRHLREILAKMETEKVRILVTVPYYDPRHAAFVREHSAADSVELSLQVKRGSTYLTTMNQNLQALLDLMIKTGSG
ncbi:MAG: metal ABC transporter substrate-binding protein [Planctomycetota bacterium]|jgi:ABC-type Zn uptake system ZnuABC Zn-binding protein ZnuA